MTLVVTSISGSDWILNNSYRRFGHRECINPFHRRIAAASLPALQNNTVMNDATEKQLVLRQATALACIA